MAMSTPGPSAESLRLPLLPVKMPSPSRTHSKSVPTDLELPFIPVATKVEKYARLCQLDRSGLKRHKAHFRNALKTTENIQKISKQLGERLAGLYEHKGKVSFERLAAHSDAFEEVIKQSGVFAPILQKIKEAYHHHLMALLSQDSHPSMLELVSTLDEPIYAPPSSSQQLNQLRKQLHQLEIEYRVTTQQNKKLQHDLAAEEEIHKKAMTDLVMPLQITPKNQVVDGLSYASQVEQLQLLIAKKRMAIAKVTSERKGRIPLSVCHQLEQCIREVEIEIQKHQRHNQQLRKEVQQLYQQIEALFDSEDSSLSEILTKLDLQ